MAHVADLAGIAEEPEPRPTPSQLRSQHADTCEAAAAPQLAFASTTTVLSWAVNADTLSLGLCGTYSALS